jgi:hypothetical protein
MSRLILLRMTNVFRRAVEKTKTHILWSIIFFSKMVPFIKLNGKKYCRAGQATDDSMEHARCLLDTSGYKCIIRMSTAYWFPLQQLLHERHSMIHYTYIAYRVKMLTSIILPVEGSCFIYYNTHINENIRWKFWNDTNKETNRNT